MTSTLDNRKRYRWRRAVIVAAAAGALLAVAAALVVMEIDRAPTPEAGAANLRALRPFWIASAFSWLALTGLWLDLRRTGAAVSPSGRRFLGPGLVVLGVAALARLIVLAGHDPALSDDVYRYVFDGRNTAAGVNPYTVRPAERAGAADERWPGESAVAARVNNPELYTIYLPASQWAFATTGALAPPTVEDPSRQARAFRTGFVVAELIAGGAVLGVLFRRRASPWWLALYAWHPLPLAEIAGSGHQDAVGLALLAIALLLAATHPARIWAWTMAIAAAALVKPMVLPAALLLLRGRSWRTWATSLAVGAATCTVIAAPLLLGDDGAPIRNLAATAQRFSLKWAHFGGVYESGLAAIGALTPTWGNDPQERLARAFCLALLAAVIIGAWRRGRDAWRDLDLVFLAMVLLSPAAHPWYLLWAMILLPVARRPATWIASLTLPWGYAALGDPVEWTVSPWLIASAWGPVFVALALNWRAAPGPAEPEPK